MRCGLICIVTLDTDNVSFIRLAFFSGSFEECWHGAVSVLSTPHSIHSFKASCDVVPRKPQSRTRAAETGASGDPRALHLGFLSQDLSAQHPPDTRWWAGQVSILPKGRDS